MSDLSQLPTLSPFSIHYEQPVYPPLLFRWLLYYGVIGYNMQRKHPEKHSASISRRLSKHPRPVRDRREWSNPLSAALRSSHVEFRGRYSPNRRFLACTVLIFLVQQAVSRFHPGTEYKSVWSPFYHSTMATWVLPYIMTMRVYNKVPVITNNARSPSKFHHSLCDDWLICAGCSRAMCPPSHGVSLPPINISGRVNPLRWRWVDS